MPKEDRTPSKNELIPAQTEGRVLARKAHTELLRQEVNRLMVRVNRLEHDNQELINRMDNATGTAVCNQDGTISITINF